MAFLAAALPPLNRGVARRVDATQVDRPRPDTQSVADPRRHGPMTPTVLGGGAGGSGGGSSPNATIAISGVTSTPSAIPTIAL